MSQNSSTSQTKSTINPNSSYENMCRQAAKKQYKQLLNQLQAKHKSDMEREKMKNKILVDELEEKNKKIKLLDRQIQILRAYQQQKLQNSLSNSHSGVEGLSVIMESSQIQHHKLLEKLEKENYTLKTQNSKLKSELAQYIRKEYSEEVDLAMTLDQVANKAKSNQNFREIMNNDKLSSYFMYVLKNNGQVELYRKTTHQNVTEVMRQSEIKSVHIFRLRNTNSAQHL